MKAQRKRHLLKRSVGNFTLLKPVPTVKQQFCEMQHN